MAAQDPPAPDFSDSDQAWFDALSARATPATPPSPAAQDGELLRRALARRSAARQAAEQAADEVPLHQGPGFADEAQRQRWLRVQARLQQPAADAAGPVRSQPGPADDRPPLRPTAAQPIAPRWRTRLGWTGGGALAAGLLAALVIAQRPGDIERIYDEPPQEAMRGDTVVQRLPAAQPRQAAEALHAALRQAGEPAGLHQQGQVFIVLLQVSSETTPAARAALAAAGVQVQSGPLRVEFLPR